MVNTKYGLEPAVGPLAESTPAQSARDAARQAEEAAVLAEELAEQLDSLTLSREAMEELLRKAEESKKRFELPEIPEIKIKSTPPKDSSAQLTQRLVTASTQFEVRSVVAQAQRSLTSARIAAATAEGEDAKKARAIVRKLEKLINRAGRKIENLNNEDNLKIDQHRAEQARQSERARQIKAELRNKRQRRDREEFRWLREATGAQIDTTAGAPNPFDRLDTVSEAEIAAQAEAMAAAEAAAGADAGGGGEIAVGDGGVAVEGGGGAGGGEAAAVEGGSVDISV